MIFSSSFFCFGKFCRIVRIENESHVKVTVAHMSDNHRRKRRALGVLLRFDDAIRQPGNRNADVRGEHLAARTNRQSCEVRLRGAFSQSVSRSSERRKPLKVAAMMFFRELADCLRLIVYIPSIAVAMKFEKKEGRDGIVRFRITIACV